MPRLTKREMEIIDALIDHTTDREIATYLHIEPATVSRHLANIYAKTGLNRRIQVALWWIGQGRAQADEAQPASEPVEERECDR